MKTITLGRIPALFLGAMIGVSGCGSSPPEAKADSAAPPATSSTSSSNSSTSCPASVDPSAFTTSDNLWADVSFLASLGLRATGSPTHHQFLDWISQRLDTIPGIQRDYRTYPIKNRWLEKSASLEAGPAAGVLTSLRVSGAVPYSQVTPSGGVGAQLIYVPTGTPITSVDVRNKIIVRDAVPGSVPIAVFLALQWWNYDPDGSLAKIAGDNYERDFLAYLQRVQDLVDAGTAHAAGLVFVHGFPYAQMRGFYMPYEGLNWPVPSIQVGADEGQTLKALAGAGGYGHITLSADEVPGTTQTLIATLPGASAERMVIESHTDGTNAHEDDGPIVMLAMLKYFASLPTSCLPKTLQFVFTTAHFHQFIYPTIRDAGAEQFARELDRDYDNGSVAMVVALEHIGTKHYDAVPRSDGGPGREFKLSGTPEIKSAFMTDSPVLVASVFDVVASHDDRGFLALRGADVPGPHIPAHFSFGGEGTPYNKHLIPTFAYINAPWVLFNPAFELESIDKDQLYHQTIMFTDLVTTLSGLSRYLLAGSIIADRQARDQACAQGQTQLVAYCKY